MSYLEVTGYTIRQTLVAALTCDFDVARTLASNHVPEATGQVIDLEALTGNSTGSPARAVVTGAREVPARDRSPLVSAAFRRQFVGKLELLKWHHVALMVETRGREKVATKRPDPAHYKRSCNMPFHSNQKRVSLKEGLDRLLLEALLPSTPAASWTGISTGGITTVCIRATSSPSAYHWSTILTGQAGSPAAKPGVCMAIRDFNRESKTGLQAVRAFRCKPEHLIKGGAAG